MSAREAGNSGEAEARARIDWRSLTEVVPAGLELMPMTTVMRQAFELVGNAADAHGFVAASGVTQARLREARIPLQIRERSAEQGVLPPTELSQSQRRWLGQLALGLYFVFAKMAENPDDGRKSNWGNWTGLIIASLNPGLILSWSAIAAIVISSSGIIPTTAQKLTFAAGVGSGVAFGYLTLIWTLRKFGRQLESKLIRTVIRVVGTGFIAGSLWNFIQLLGSP